MLSRRLAARARLDFKFLVAHERRSGRLPAPLVPHVLFCIPELLHVN